MDALEKAKGILQRDAEMQAPLQLRAEDLANLYLKVNALAAVAQAEQLKRVADALEWRNQLLEKENQLMEHIAKADNHPELDATLDEMERQAEAQEGAL